MTHIDNTARVAVEGGEYESGWRGPGWAYPNGKILPPMTWTSNPLDMIPDEGFVYMGSPYSLYRDGYDEAARLASLAAAALMFKGLTAQYLLRQTYRVAPGQTILFHAAAGGVGLVACQWAKLLGATVIGTVGSTEKAKLARAHGCAHTILYREEDFVQRVRAITKGALCDVVYDGVGASVFPASLDCLKRRGAFVSFGNASGKIAAIDPMMLHDKGSRWATKTKLYDHMPTREALLEAAADLFDAVRQGVKPLIGQRYALKDAAEAHRALEARATIGSSVLVPE